MSVPPALLPVPSTAVLEHARGPNPHTHTPPRPRNAFALFSESSAMQGTGQVSSANKVEFGRHMAHLWSRMSDGQKRPWMDMEKEEMKRWKIAYA